MSITQLTIPNSEYGAGVYTLAGGYLAYKTDSTEGIVGERKSILKTIQVIDLYNRLYSYEWLRPYLKSVNSKGHLSVYPPYKSSEEIASLSSMDSLYYRRYEPVSLLSTLQEGIERENNTSNYEQLSDELDRNVSEIEKFLNENKEIINSSENDSSYLSNPISEPIVYNLIHGGQYTNIISLENIIQKCSSSPDTIISVNINYSKGNNIFDYSSKFKPMRVRNGVITESEFIRRFHDDVELEFTNGILRAMPISNEVVECIITNCIVTYGKL
jgi:hypothetical protein